jgi:gliding motility-associated-like protein
MIVVNDIHAAFTYPAATCINAALNFSNTSSPAGGNSTWSFGDGATSNATNPSHTYSVAGTYTVKLVYSNNGCSDSTTHTITVSTLPTVDFSASSTYNCNAPFTVNFTNLAGGAASYSWDFGDGNTSTSANPSHTYTASGSYSVTLTVTNAAGCTATITKPNYIVIQPATATITATGAGCVPANVLFTTSITPSVTPVAYNINYGDGTNANVNGGWHNYTAAGTYNVTYTYTLSAGCVGTATTTVSLSTPATPGFTSAPDTVCPGNPVSFTNTSTGATSYVWLFGDGGTSTQVNPSHVYNDPGTYTVQLVAINGFCADTLTMPNLVFVKFPLAEFSAALTNCNNRFSYTFTNNSQGADTDNWDFGDGTTSNSNATTVSHTYAATGTYTVTLTVTNSATGCMNVKTMVLPVFVPVDTFNANPTSICKGTPIAFTGSVNNGYYTNYAWDFGDGNTSATNHTNTQTHIYNASGTYNVTLTITDTLGCQTVFTRPAYIHIGGPGVGFSASPNHGCAGLLVTFTDDCYPGNGNTIVSRNWDFGDGNGNIGNVTNPTHVYSVAGTYNVILTAADQIGCSSQNHLTVTITKPTASFTGDTLICPYGTANFQNNSVGAVGYSWSFGDGATSTQANPSHSYTAVGYYPVKLIATSAEGCTDTITHNVHVVTLHISFSLSDTFSSCPPLSVSVTGTSPASLVSYNWTFGNGNQSVNATPSVLYTYPGNYTVKLVATNNIGCTDSATIQVTILGPTGTLAYGPAGGCTPLTVSFSSNNQNTTSISWDMNNGYTQTTSGVSNFTYTYTQTGKYVPVIILSNGSCQVPVKGVDTIKVDAVTGDFTTANVCVGTTANFHDTLFNSLTSVSYSWNFGDGATATGHNPAHTYTLAGTYHAKLYMTNATGCIDTISHDIIIHALPNINAGANQAICQGASPVSLQATGGNNYVWSPAATLSCSACANPAANPTATTTYVVTGTDSNTCVNTSSVTVTVNPLPTVAATPNTAICNGSTATIGASGAATYTWSPATGLSCTNCASPVASPTATTTYVVTGTNASNCSNTASVTVTVNPLPAVTISGNTTICNNTSTNLLAAGATTYSWSPATGLSCTNCANPTVNPSATTTYTVTGNNGTCDNVATVTVTVNPLPEIGIANNAAVCLGSSVNLQVSGASSYVWSPATGLSCTNCANPAASPTATTTYTITGTDNNSCSNFTTMTVTVNPLPNVGAGNNASICAGASTNLQGTGAVNYAWSPATGLSCTNCGSPVANPTATTTYIVSGTDANNCSNTASVTVTVNPLPVITINGNTTICQNTSTALQASGANTYTWSPATGLSCTNCANPIATLASTTTYTVTGDNGTCTNTTTVTVNVHQLPTINAGNNAAICAGVGTNLAATGATSYTWFPATGLSCTNCANPVANPSATTTYTITGTDNNSCSNTATVSVTVNALPTVNAGNNAAVCLGAATNLQGTGAVNYAWTPATGLSCTNCANPSAAPAATTTYSVIGTDTHGCKDTAAVTVTVNPLPVISAGPDTSVCTGLSTQLNATGGVSYTWSPAAGLSCTNCASPLATPAGTLSYIVTGVDANSCSNKDTVVVTVHNLPQVTVPAQSACIGNTAQLNATGATTYVWAAASSLSCTNCNNPVANPTVTTTYTVFGTSGYGCTDSAHVTVTINPLPVIHAITGENPICHGTTTTMQATGASSYVWTPAIGLSCTNCSNTIAGPQDTTIYYVVGTDANGCSNKDSATIFVMKKPVIAVSPDTFVCKGNSVGLSVTGATTYAWSPAATLSCNNCAQPSATPNTNTNYTVIGTAANGCKDTAHVAVSLYAQPVINAGNDTVICSGTAANLAASGAKTYTWFPATGLSCTNCPAPVADPSYDITYTVIGVDVHGCSDSARMKMTVRQHTPAGFNATDSICSGGTLPLNATGGVAYDWSPATDLSDANIANPTAQPTATTLYTVLIKENECFTDTGRVMIVVDTIPTVKLGNDIKLVAGNTVQLNPAVTGHITSYDWTPANTLSCNDCASPTATPDGNTTYVVTVSTRFGCKATDSVKVDLGCDKSQVFIPNTFTPNNDGLNDKFYASGKGIKVINRFSVYDRWGELMYEADNIPVDDPKFGWDGTFKGEKLKPDVYVYIIQATCEAGSRLDYKGDVSLIR